MFLKFAIHQCAFRVDYLPNVDSTTSVFPQKNTEPEYMWLQHELESVQAVIFYVEYERRFAFSVFLAVFRGFWTVLIILGLVSALTGGFFLVCGVPFISHKLYKLGGAFLIAAGKLLTTVCACVEFTISQQGEMYTDVLPVNVYSQNVPA